ncbi:MAG: short-chain dehydrogenase [Acidimicrobiales bacterium]|nr:short-chain dehydrogenase [Acidimicrobiales bacterium]
MLDGQVAVVSGVGPGLGRAIALRLADAGADVAIGARRAAQLELVGKEIETRGRRAVTRPTDVTDADQCRALVDQAAAELGRVDILVNNAFAEEDWREPFTGFDPKRWRTPVDVNLFGTLNMIDAAVPHLRRAGGGSIVNITSLSIKTVNPVLGGYAASKAALTTASHVLAKELGPDGIRVNCVAPGHIMGDSLRNYFSHLGERRGVDAQTVHDEIAAGNSLNRITTAEEVADVVLFFASPRSRVITGQSLAVNCGRTTE